MTVETGRILLAGLGNWDRLIHEGDRDMSELQGFVDAGDSYKPWQIVGEISNHAGGPIEADAEFFAPPPAEIGEVITAYTTLKQGRKSRSGSTRLLIATVVGGLTWLIVVMFLRMAVGSDSMGKFRLFAPIPAIIDWLLAFFLTGFKHRCSYVGSFGVARYEITGNRQTESTIELFQFSQAGELYNKIVRNYYNGVPTGTNFDFHWYAGKASIFQIKGTFSGCGDNPKVSSTYHLGRVAEMVWSDFLIDSLNEQLDQQGAIDFRTSDGGGIRISREYIEFASRKGTERLELADIGELKIDGGRVMFKHKEAGWLSSKGKYNFDYASIANGHCMMMVLNQILGVEFE